MPPHGIDHMALLEVSNLRLSLPDRGAKRPFGAPPLVDILKDVDLELEPGESLGIVGESGSGKTSLGRTLLRLYRPTGGSIRFEGQDITSMSERDLRPLRADMQMIFQNPQSSLNARRRIGAILAQPLLVYGRVKGREEARARARSLLELVGLPGHFATRYSHELSGGQRQRVAIARALALEPKFVVADEIVSGLDVSTQAQILDLLRDLRRRFRLALIFISHDLSVVRVVCDRILVLLAGEVVERGRCEEIFANPRHHHTRSLLGAIPLPEVDPHWIDGAALDEVGPQEANGR